jgi:hypothetical protein
MQKFEQKNQQCQRRYRKSHPMLQVVEFPGCFVVTATLPESAYTQVSLFLQCPRTVVRVKRRTPLGKAFSKAVLFWQNPVAGESTRDGAPTAKRGGGFRSFKCVWCAFALIDSLNKTRSVYLLSGGREREAKRRTAPVMLELVLWEFLLFKQLKAYRPRYCQLLLQKFV